MRGFFKFRPIAATLVFLLLAISGIAPAAAFSANISHSYGAIGTLPNGSIVSLDANKSNFVEAANTDNGTRLLGVVVPSDDSLLAVDPSDVLSQVATSGQANALVSTLNGNIKVGDLVAVSPFNGIGMKSEAGAHVIGLAQTAFDGSSGASQTVKGKNGKTTDIKIGLVRVNIAVGTDNSSNTAQLSGLQRFGKALTGHTVSTLRLVVSLIIALVAFVSLAVLIYASIYGSIISIGRNPLAKYAIFRTLGSVLGMAALTAIVASATIFLILH